VASKIDFSFMPSAFRSSYVHASALLLLLTLQPRCTTPFVVFAREPLVEMERESKKSERV
jgi:hypothetical protein